MTLRNLIYLIIQYILHPFKTYRLRKQLAKFKKFDEMYNKLSRQQKRKMLRDNKIAANKRKRRRKASK